MNLAPHFKKIVDAMKERGIVMVLLKDGSLAPQRPPIYTYPAMIVIDSISTYEATEKEKTLCH